MKITLTNTTENAVLPKDALEDFMVNMHSVLTAVEKDLNKATDVEAATYYWGLFDAYREVENMFTKLIADKVIVTVAKKELKRPSNLAMLATTLLNHPRAIVWLIS